MSFPFPPSLTPFYAFSPAFVSRVAAVNLINFKQALLAWLMYSDGAKYLQKREKKVCRVISISTCLSCFAALVHPYSPPAGAQSLHPAEELKQPTSPSPIFPAPPLFGYFTFIVHLLEP